MPYRLPQTVLYVAAPIALLFVILGTLQSPKLLFSQHRPLFDRWSMVNITQLTGGSSKDSLPQPLHPYNCMTDIFAMGKGSVHTAGRLSSEDNLCAIFNGRVRNINCEYHHPNVVHFVKLSRSPKQNILSFQEYLSILSVHKFYKPDRIIIHCNNQPITGRYWDKAANLSTPIELRRTERVTNIGYWEQTPYYVTHEADFIKVSTALKEGGIYMDFDAVILNGTLLREMQRKSELVIGRDNNECTRVCAGFFSSVPNSPFIRKWLKGYENDYWPSSWLYNAGEIPSMVLRSCPTCYDVIIDAQMSNWKDSFGSDWLRKDGLDWKHRAVSHYMNAAFMKPLKEPNELLKMDCAFSDMIKYVLGESYTDFL